MTEWARPRRSSHGRYRALDGLRGVAVSVVVMSHLAVPWATGGGTGVFAFFTLSGLLITWLLCRELEGTDRINLVSFWERRVRRLLVPLLLTVAVTVTFSAFAGQGRDGLRQSLVSLTYVANWWRVREALDPSVLSLGPLEHTWSLAVEEQFYLVWPILFWGLYRLSGRRLGRVAALTAVLAVASAAVRVLAWDPTQPVRSALLLYNRTDSQAELFLLGALGGMALHRMRGRAVPTWVHRWVPTAALLGAGGLLASELFTPFTPDGPMHLYWTLGLTGLALSTVAVCVAGVVRPDCGVSRVLSLRPLVGLGRISYGVYLYHYPLVFLLPAGAGWVEKGAVAVTTLVLAALSWQVVERPLVAGGRRSTHCAERPPLTSASQERVLTP